MELFHIGFLSVRLLDIIDILIVAWLLYKLYRLLKGGVAMNILIGILTIYFLWWLFVKVLDMQLLGALLGQFGWCRYDCTHYCFSAGVKKVSDIYGPIPFSLRGDFFKNLLHSNFKINQMLKQA
ncbi:MAG: hypothetical protein R2847_09230 [Bacteroidia bacterium]